ncbi:MAG: hypothetical protein Q8J68_14725 [Methanolobus sp.]|uniref:hypothetical protein n=1 Tax=Methanolobus sp. TaxID=1874737 RepID=UPI002731A1B1|nr:hypothetical protein [Methanolobus sp.]MDP2218529.1 hypothetical protein [Methanolobus sp.]
MAAYNKFNVFVEDLTNKLHDIFGTGAGADSLRILLTNTSPNVADTVVDTVDTPCTIEATSMAVELAAGNGYTKKGELVTNNGTRSAGTMTLSGTKVVWTCATAAMGPFRYVALYNDAAGAAATRPVIAWWDYGSALTLQVGETFSCKFNNSDTVGTILAIA